MIRICRNCKYQMTYNRGEIYDHEDRYKCYYWNAELGKLIRSYGCEKFEPKEEK